MGSGFDDSSGRIVTPHKVGDHLGDVLVACTASGLVHVLAPVVLGVEPLTVFNEIMTYGTSFRFQGKPCSGCSSGDRRYCEYRPLVGPLYVPRPS
jgi:hypothetical protein